MAGWTAMLDVEVIEDPAAAVVALDPLRARMLGELREPASASALGQRLGIPRQKVNYHLRALEASGLVAPHEERRHGGLTERRLVATAAAYVVSPAALGTSAPSTRSDPHSARYLVALAARLVREVGALARAAAARRTHPALLAVDAEIAFATPADRARFAEDLTAAVTRLAADYHHDGGRPHRLLVAAHPLPEEDA
jgi:DNA-binding transcriptional ArsR family regulator